MDEGILRSKYVLPGIVQYHVALFKDLLSAPVFLSNARRIAWKLGCGYALCM
jgi:hypothetical protein